MNDFIAIDVETANNHPSSICALGAVKVSAGVIVGKFYKLVKPEPEYYFRHFSENIHSIFREDTEDAPTFDYVWVDMLKQFGLDSHPEKAVFVAHNKIFDEKCLKEAHRVYGMTWCDNVFLCTLQKARRTIPRQLIGSYSLPVLCDFMGIPFNNHHNALADAEACAKIAMKLL